MAALYPHLAQASNVAAFAVVYGIFLSMGELGPGNNIGLLAAKTCATGVRGRKLWKPPQPSPKAPFLEVTSQHNF